MPVQLSAFGADEVEPASSIAPLVSRVLHGRAGLANAVPQRFARLAATPVVTHGEAPNSAKPQEADPNGSAHQQPHADQECPGQGGGASPSGVGRWAADIPQYDSDAISL